MGSVTRIGDSFVKPSAIAIQRGETHLGIIKTIPHVLQKCKAQMETCQKGTYFNIARKEMLSVRRKPTAFTIWKTNLLHCPI